MKLQTSQLTKLNKFSTNKAKQIVRPKSWFDFSSHLLMAIQLGLILALSTSHDHAKNLFVSYILKSHQRV